MYKTLLSLVVLAGTTLAVASPATAAPAAFALPPAIGAAHVQTVQYREDWRHREWRHREEMERHRREAAHHWRHEHGGW